MKLQLKAVLLGLTGIATVLVMLGSLWLSLDERIRAAHHRMAVQTQRLGSAGVPLLLNSLVVGDLASAEQTLENLNLDMVWRNVRLDEADGRTLILDASPRHQLVSTVPAWVRRLMPLKVTETRIPIAADPVSRADLAVSANAPASAEFTSKQPPFVDFVLAQYVKQGVDELDQEKLSPLLKLRYNALAAPSRAGRSGRLRRCPPGGPSGSRRERCPPSAARRR